jgi:hypothetical protein
MQAWVRAVVLAGKAEEEAADLAGAEAREQEAGLELAGAKEVKDNEGLHSHHG